MVLLKSFDYQYKENFKKPIYKANLQENYTISGAGMFDGEVEGAWEDNDGALIKEAIKTTTDRINVKLAQYLADPFNKNIQTQIQQEKITKTSTSN